MTTMGYTETSRILKSEGFATEDIDAVIDSLIDKGITFADEDELLLTEAEVGVIRSQLATTAQRPSDLIDDGYGLRARGGLIYFG